MASCVITRSDNSLVMVDKAIEECTGNVLLTPHEYLTLFSFESFDGSQISQMFLLGFALIFCSYLISYPAGVIINFIKSL